MRIDILLSQSKVTWQGKEMPPHPRKHFDDKHTLHQALTNEPHSTAEACANVVNDDTATKCTNANRNQLVLQQDHSTLECKEMLLKTLQKHIQPFEGLDNKQLGIFPNQEHHIDLNQGAKACHIEQLCSVPLNQTSAVKTEIK